MAQSFLVLRQDEIYFVAFKMGESVDHAVRRNDGLVFEHQRFQPFRVHDMAGKRECRIHDDGVRRKSPEVCRMAKESLGMA